MPLAAEKPITSYFPKVSAGQKRKASGPDPSSTLTKKSRVKKHPSRPQIDPPKATPSMKEEISPKVSRRAAQDAERSTKGTEVLDVIEIPSDEPERSNPDPESPTRESYQESPQSYRYLEPSSLVASLDSPIQFRQHATFSFSSPSKLRLQPTEKSSFVRSNRNTAGESSISAHTTHVFAEPSLPDPGWSIPKAPETPERIIESSQTQYLSPLYSQPGSPLKRSPSRNDEVIPSSQSQEIELRYHSSSDLLPSPENGKRRMYLFASYDDDQHVGSQEESLSKRIPAPDFTRALRQLSPQSRRRSLSPPDAESRAGDGENLSQPESFQSQAAAEKADRFDPFHSSQTQLGRSPQRESEYETLSLPSPVKQFQAMFDFDDDDQSYPPDFPESLR